MSVRKIMGSVICGAVLVVGLASSASAANGNGNPSRLDGTMRKLGRGIADVATCPLELLRTPTLLTRRDGLIAGWSIGVVQGIWRTVLRGVTGVFEVATFYAEIPDGYGPLLKPEFVWENGDWAE